MLAQAPCIKLAPSTRPAAAWLSITSLSLSKYATICIPNKEGALAPCAGWHAVLQLRARARVHVHNARAQQRPASVLLLLTGLSIRSPTVGTTSSALALCACGPADTAWIVLLVQSRVQLPGWCHSQACRCASVSWVCSLGVPTAQMTDGAAKEASAYPCDAAARSWGLAYLKARLPTRKPGSSQCVPGLRPHAWGRPCQRVPALRRLQGNWAAMLRCVNSMGGGTRQICSARDLGAPELHLHAWHWPCQ